MPSFLFGTFFFAFYTALLVAWVLVLTIGASLALSLIGIY